MVQVEVCPGEKPQISAQEVTHSLGISKVLHKGRSGDKPSDEAHFTINPFHSTC